MDLDSYSHQRVLTARFNCPDCSRGTNRCRSVEIAPGQSMSSNVLEPSPMECANYMKDHRYLGSSRGFRH